MDQREEGASYHNSQGKAFATAHSAAEQLSTAPKPPGLPGREHRVPYPKEGPLQGSCLPDRLLLVLLSTVFKVKFLCIPEKGFIHLPR